MSFAENPEYFSCAFELHDDGHGKPAHISLDFTSSSDFLARKQIARLFLTFKQTSSLKEAEGLVEAMNRYLNGLCIVDRDSGEP